jgi:pimeloyl-ACP methyl ester carboxylesterase
MKMQVAGATVHYVDVGPRSNPTVVLIHAFPFSSEMWKYQIRALRERYRTVAFDLRGQGKSLAGNGLFTIEFLIDDLIALLDKLNIERAILCGLSMGGYVALRTIERHNDRVSGLILCDTKSEADTNDGKLARTKAIKEINKHGVKPFAASFLENAFSPSSLANEKLVREATRIICRNKPLGLCGMLLALAARTDTTLALSQIDVPTLILVGEHDRITPPHYSKSMRLSIGDSELSILPNAGHISNLENPAEFNLHLLQFLDTKSDH